MPLNEVDLRIGPSQEQLETLAEGAIMLMSKLIGVYYNTQGMIITMNGNCGCIYKMVNAFQGRWIHYQCRMGWQIKKKHKKGSDLINKILKRYMKRKVCLCLTLESFEKWWNLQVKNIWSWMEL